MALKLRNRVTKGHCAPGNILMAASERGLGDADGPCAAMPDAPAVQRRDRYFCSLPPSVADAIRYRHHAIV